MSNNLPKYVFHRYPKIYNYHIAAKIIEKMPFLHLNEWVATLKIHGANYALYCQGENPDNYRPASRSRLLTRDESFYGHINLDYYNQAADMFKYLKTQGFEFETMVIYGEIFGGKYLHKDVKKVPEAVAVQREVQYCPHNDFIVYDIKLDSIWLDWNIIKEACKATGFLVAPEIHRGSLQEIIDLDIKVSDPLHKIWNLPEIEDNIMEGIVAKPVNNIYSDQGRIIFKMKNDKFLEKKRIKTPKQPMVLSNTAEKLLEVADNYITEARLNSVVSHIGKESIGEKSFGKLQGLLMQDLLAYLEEDEAASINMLEKKEYKEFKRKLARKVAEFVRPYFLEIVGENLARS